MPAWRGYEAARRETMLLSHDPTLASDPDPDRVERLLWAESNAAGSGGHEHLTARGR